MHAPQTPWRKTTIALDFDCTFTSDIEFWRGFVESATRRGHTVICVTGRTESPEKRQEVESIFGADTVARLGAIIFCNHTPKRLCATAAGWDINIWIDDFPEAITSDQTTIRALELVKPVYETLPVFDTNNVHPSRIWRSTDVFPD